MNKKYAHLLIKHLSRFILMVTTLLFLVSLAVMVGNRLPLPFTVLYVFSVLTTIWLPLAGVAICYALGWSAIELRLNYLKGRKALAELEPVRESLNIETGS